MSVLRVCLRRLVLAAPLMAVGCSGLDLGDNPGREVPKADPGLTAFPAHLRDGARD